MSHQIDWCVLLFFIRTRFADSVRVYRQNAHDGKKKHHCIRKWRNRLLVLGHVTNAISEWFVKHCEVLHSNSKGPSSCWSVLPVATAFWFATRRTSLKCKFALAQASESNELSFVRTIISHFSPRSNKHVAEAIFHQSNVAREDTLRVLTYWNNIPA